MTTTPALFYIFSAVMLLAAFRVITARSPVYAALYLVLSFFSASCVWMLLRAEFLSIALILVYVGAVMVLFLFVVMMLDINTDTLREGFWKHAPVAGLVGLVIALEMAGIAVSAGAACSSGKVARSHVLDAMGLEAAAGQTIRVSLAWNTTQADIAAFADAYRAVAARLLRRNA